MGLEESSMKKATIQMNLFDYFYEQDNFTIKEAGRRKISLALEQNVSTVSHFKSRA